MRRVAPLLAVVLLAGCGSNPRDRTTRVETLAAHVQSLAREESAAAATGDKEELHELVTEARLAQEDIEQTVPLDEPGRSQALSAAESLVATVVSDLDRVQQ